MKRPVSFAALGITAVLLAHLAFAGRIVGEPDRSRAWVRDKNGTALEDRSQLFVNGHVRFIEQRKDSYGNDILWVYLDRIMIFNGEDFSEIPYQIICQCDISCRPRVGSLVMMCGEFCYYDRATNPGQFDASQYYFGLGICGRLKNAYVTAESDTYSHIGEWLYLLRRQWEENINNSFPEKEASVLNAMILGDKAGVESDIKALYRDNGIFHILSVSGLHITLIGMGLYRLLRRIAPVWLSAVLGSIVMIMYGLMTGMAISAVRAVGMYLIRMLAEVMGRTYDMLTALGIMAIVMLMLNPGYLYLSGFFLSFGSVCGIGLLMSSFDKKNKLWNMVLPGLCVTVFTLPIQLYFFYEIPVYSVLLNMMILPFMSIVMVCGILVMIFPVLHIAVWVDTWILTGYEFLCHLFERLPYHTWNPGAPAPWQIIVYYVILFAGVCIWKGKSEKEQSSGKLYSFLHKSCSILLIGSAICIAGLHFSPKLRITMLDVGQGDCFCVQMGRQVYIFDCGSSSRSGVGEYILIPYLKYYGISHVDAVFVSHPDFDHISGILELLDPEKNVKIFVDALVLPDISVKRRVSELGNFLTAAENAVHSPTVIYVGNGFSWQSDNGLVNFTCLHPERGSILSDPNEYSECFLLQYGDFSMLFTGDTENEGEEELNEALRNSGIMGEQEDGRMDISVLKVAHHGSRNSTGEEFLKLVHPGICLISCGKDNFYGHPHSELMERLERSGCMICQTTECGAVELDVNAESIKLRRYLTESTGAFE